MVLDPILHFHRSRLYQRMAIWKKGRIAIMVILPVIACDPGAIRTLNQQNRNLSFYPLNYGTIFLLQKYNQNPGYQNKPG